VNTLPPCLPILPCALRKAGGKRRCKRQPGGRRAHQRGVACLCLLPSSPVTAALTMKNAWRAVCR